MTQIKIDLDVVDDLNGNVNQNIYKLSNVNSSVSSLTYHVDSAITARRNIRSRLQNTSQSLRELETRLKELNSFIKNSIDSYSRTESDLSRKAQSIGDRKVTLEELFTRKSDRYTTEQLNEIWNQLSDDDRKTISKQFSENWFKQVLKDIGNDIAYAAETSWDSFGEIGNDFLNGLQTRADKALDSPYDFINWLTIGASGGIYEGAKDRADHMWDSTYDFFNWLTVGTVETVDEAFTPDKPLSKEHWLASLGVASILYGGAKGKLGSKAGDDLAAEEISAGFKNFSQSSEKPSKIERGQDPNVIEKPEKVYPTRIINETNEIHIIGRVKELRSNLSSAYKKSGNFALAEVNIVGIGKTEFYAHSSINKFKGDLEEKLPTISLQPSKPVFHASEAANKQGDIFLRDTDTEYKILNDIASRLGENKEATGKIKLFTELDTCASCSKVIAEFSEKYPKIELEIVHNNGERLTP